MILIILFLIFKDKNLIKNSDNPNNCIDITNFRIEILSLFVKKF